jgi:hypothetical protein
VEHQDLTTLGSAWDLKRGQGEREEGNEGENMKKERRIREMWS